MARRLPRRVGKPRPAQLAEDAVVVVRLAGLANGAGDAQLPLQLVAGVAEAGVQLRAPGVRPAVGLARSARDVERAVALGGDLLPRRAAAAVHAHAVRVLVGAGPPHTPRRHARPCCWWPCYAGTCGTYTDSDPNRALSHTPRIP
jgi:hypothetical protein